MQTYTIEILGARHGNSDTHMAAWPLGTRWSSAPGRAKFGLKTKAEGQTEVCSLHTSVTPLIKRCDISY